ncbi:Kinesin (KAR3 subfamily) [Handroanthus impetiginosus]|uniref:Kinesin (KAR3 subfamily) n=1 Tax=Handroanthus impetiginosus TaxID=429701 RepID=A0A2G9HEY6_9LAMI|nr:Kinesin (KAR3 subfamily) [Handroanthus impetiginosus]
MEDLTRRGRVGEINLASRRAEEAALRRYQAVHWLDYLVGPLGIPSQPSEKEFISCLRNGLILCNVINKVQAGSVPKVIESTSASQSLPWYSQPLPAYQYFENVRNFLVAVEELKLPIFEASVFERENLEEGSSMKVVDCILELKAYHEWKQMTGGNGLYKPPRSPVVLNSAGRLHSLTPGSVARVSSRQLDMSGESNKLVRSASDIRKLEDKIVKALADQMVDMKENMDDTLIASYRSGNMDSMKFFKTIVSGCLEEQFQGSFPEMKSSILDHLREKSYSPVHSTMVPLADLSNLQNRKCCRACLKKGNCHHWNLLEQQERELSNIKLLLSSAKQDVESLQSQLQSDFKQLGDQVLEMSAAALGYHKAVKENRHLYNLVQDLKGNIRVYCRIRPAFNHEVQNVIDFTGEDGSLIVVDPKLQKDGKKMFQFNHVFGPTATQDEVFSDTRQLIRSVMDGYNVCIFAYGQTGSGKTYTMSGPPGGSTKELGISYLALNDLFELSSQRKDITKYEIQVQMVEIYNEQVRDLLAEDSCAKKLEIRSCVSDNSLALPDATLCPVKSPADVINLMKLGEVNRAVGSTALNIRSSRSHSVLSVHVHGEDTSGSIINSCLHLVDLAGSERVDKSEVTGDGLREAQHINKSLSCLVDVITALAQKNSHIPYRNSKLTLLLQNSLGGNSKTLMFAHVNPEDNSFAETMSTLKFAQRVSTVELGAARANKESSEVLDLKAQIQSLKKALAKKEAHTPPTKRTKEAVRTPYGKPKQITERTPPRPRRLSIENGNTTAMERSMNHDEKREAKTPSVKPQQLSEKTPPRSRRLNIENGSTTMAVERSTIRSRRLSLEGPRNHSQLEVGRSCGQKESIGSLMDQRAPRSPISSATKIPMVKIDTTTMKLPSFQIPKTPEAQMKSRNGIQRVLPSDHNMSSDIRTPCSTQGKGSQIRKSLRTIGKLINGSEKRNQQKAAEAMTPIIHDVKSPTSSNARALRRQSLTGIQPPERSRRSSLGGVSMDSYGQENRNAKTPPQVRASAKLTKRWL